VRSASGVTLSLEADDGEVFEAIDAMSSWWCMIHGYRNPALDEALRSQMERFSHVMFGGLTHEPAVRLAEALVRLSPAPLEHVFFADSGSVSVEVALKLAVQFQVAKGHVGRHRFLACRGSYHGDTIGAMSVCDPVDGMHAAFPSLVPEQVFVPRPPPATLVEGELVADEAAVQAWIAHLEATLELHQAEIAAIIIEPVLQGAGGMFVFSPACLVAMRRLADAHGILLIFDEIATGFGRTGKFFAAEWAEVAPDVMCVGKALTGGYLSLAAVLCSAEVGAVITGSGLGALLHGPTFMANPLACAVALASLELLDAQWSTQVSEAEATLTAALSGAASLASVRDVRVLGGVGVLELHEPVDVQGVTRAALERGVWLRPFRNLVYSMPPYLSTRAEVASIASAMTGAVKEVHG
jgi:adenosylmethionine-8-amino-7-oxononanoate aminotransferase